MAGKQTIKNIEGYVLRVSSYKENDAMVTVLSAEGLFSFLARGVLKNTNKNFSSCQLLAKSKFSLNEQKNGNYSLSESDVISVPDGKSSLLRLGIFSFVSETCLKLVIEEESLKIYPWLDKTMDDLKNEGKEASSALIFLSHLLNEIGYGLEVNECVRCGGKTRIVGVSFKDGGFVCNDCADESDKMDMRDLKILRFCFKCQLEDVERAAFTTEESIKLIKRLIKYIDNFTGVKLKSLELL